MSAQWDSSVTNDGADQPHRVRLCRRLINGIWHPRCSPGVVRAVASVARVTLVACPPISRPRTMYPPC